MIFGLGMRTFFFVLAALSLFAVFSAEDGTFGYDEDGFQEDTSKDLYGGDTTPNCLPPHWFVDE